MKNPTPRLIALGLALAFALPSAELAAQTLKPSKAKVRAVRGQVQYRADAAAPLAPLKTGATLSPGAVVQTGAGAQADLFLTEVGSVVRLRESTLLSLDKLNFAKAQDELVTEVEMNLKAGTIQGNVRKLAAASKYEVKIPNGVVAIRGTEYKISANGVVYVISGSARVTFTAPGQPAVVRDVPAGHVFYPPVAGADAQVKPIPADDPVWREIKSVEALPGLTVEPTERPSQQPGHPTGQPK